MKTIQLVGRDESGKPVIVSVTSEEIDAAQRAILSQSGKPFVSGSCLRCCRGIPVFNSSYCGMCGE